jgi:hypothetical protein
MADFVREAVHSGKPVGMGLRAGPDNSVNGSIDEVKRATVVGCPAVGNESAGEQAVILGAAMLLAVVVRAEAAAKKTEISADRRPPSPFD